MGDRTLIVDNNCQLKILNCAIMDYSSISLPRVGVLCDCCSKFTIDKNFKTECGSGTTTVKSNLCQEHMVCSAKITKIKKLQSADHCSKTLKIYKCTIHNRIIQHRHRPNLLAFYKRFLLSLIFILIAIPYVLSAPTTSVRSLKVKLNNPAIPMRSSSLHPTFLNQSPASSSRLHKRHSKRHSIGYDPYDLNENSTTLEWVNPCGGYYDPTAVTNKTTRRKHPRKIYNALKVAAGHEFKILNDSQHAIDIDNFEMWSMHRRTYKFLPKLKKNSSIALKRWYRNIQTYVASFAYLRRVQLKWDYSKAQSESDIADELNTLLISSRSILCELETAVNKTHPYQRQKRQLPQVTRSQMNRRLKLHTRENAIQNPGAVQEANSIDLKFVKYYYYEFLENMWKVLRKITKRTGQAGLKDQKEISLVEKNILFKSKQKPNRNTKRS